LFGKFAESPANVNFIFVNGPSEVRHNAISGAYLIDPD